MSDEKKKRFMSFEDAMKKATKTKMNPAIQIEKKDEITLIPNVSGKWVQFIRLIIEDKPIEKYCLKLHLFKGKDEKVLPLFLNINPFLPSFEKAEFDLIENVNPIFVPEGLTLSVSVISMPGSNAEDFNLCALSYKVLDK